MYRSVTTSGRALHHDGQLVSVRQVRARILQQSRRRLATEPQPVPPSASGSLPPPPPPPKSSGSLRSVVLYTTLLLVGFYGGSTFLATQSERYRDFFIERAPLGERIVDWTDSKGWDRASVKNGKPYKSDFYLSGAEKKAEQVASDAVGKGKDLVAKAEAALQEKPAEVEESSVGIRSKIQEGKERVKEITGGLRTNVEKELNVLKDAKSTAIMRHQVGQLVDGLDDLVAQAENALKTTVANTLPTPSVPPLGEANVAEPGPAPEVDASAVETTEKPPANLWTWPLPLEHSVPHGYSLPSKPKASNAPPVKAEPAPPPLPLITEAISSLAGSEPIIGQLASSVDKLSSLLQSNPTAAKDAKAVLETAQLDFTNLFSRLEKIKDEEKVKFEEQLEAKIKEYSDKFLKTEVANQEQLDKQEDMWRTAFDQEREKIVNAYKERLDTELKTQSEIIEGRLKAEIIAQGVDIQRGLLEVISQRVEEERGGRLSKLKELASSFGKLQQVTVDNSNYLEESVRVHSLWSSLRALDSAINSPDRTPFRDELKLLRSVAASRDDAIISLTIDSLEASSIPDEGVEPFENLATWFFSSVAPSVVSVALVPEQDAGLLSHLASSLVSIFRSQKKGFVEGGDVASVVARAEYFMNEGDLDNATRELNQLGGTSKLLLTDWLAAARRRLEVQQAIQVVEARATEASLSLS